MTEIDFRGDGVALSGEFVIESSVLRIAQLIEEFYFAPGTRRQYDKAVRNAWGDRVKRSFRCLRRKIPSRLKNRLLMLQRKGIIFFAPSLIALLVVAVYSTSFRNPFVFDDRASIEGNPTIRALRPLSTVLAADFDDGRPVDGRPLLNLSLAINYAIGGTEVWGYHAGNLLIHILAGCVLLAILRGTFRNRKIPESLRKRANSVALFASLLWVVHPLGSAAVTYIVQRGEALASLLYLVTIYCFSRGAETPRREWIWFSASVAACLAGMATKEMMVTAPVIVLLYDRTFLAGTFRKALARRWPWYVCLGATWTLLAWLIIRSGGRGGVAVFDDAKLTWHYLLTQCEAVVRYLALTIWPGPLVFDYGPYLVDNIAAVWPQALLLLVLGGLSVWALWKRPVLGFALAWIWIILSPTSSIVPLTTQTIAEQRMYLPLASIAAMASAALFRLPGRWPVFVGSFLVIALGVRTYFRNQDYRSALVLWTDTAYKWPANVNAFWSAGMELLKSGQTEKAMTWFQKAYSLAPENPAVLESLAHGHYAEGRSGKALELFKAAVRRSPDDAELRLNLANVLATSGRLVEAKRELEEVLRLDDGIASAHDRIAILMVSQGNLAVAVAHFKKAVDIDPKSPDYHNNLGMALAQTGDEAAAREQFREALRLDPNYEQAKINLRSLRPAVGEGKTE